MARSFRIGGWPDSLIQTSLRAWTLYAGAATLFRGRRRAAARAGQRREPRFDGVLALDQGRHVELGRRRTLILLALLAGLAGGGAGGVDGEADPERKQQGGGGAGGGPADVAGAGPAARTA